MKNQVFISHDSRDRRSAEEICHGMENLGLRCWIAPRDLKPGEDFASGIVDAIEASRAFVLVYSKFSASSEMVKRELSLAADARVRIIPVRIEDYAISGSIRFFLGASHRVDAFDGNLADLVPTIVEAIVDMPGETAKVESPAGDLNAVVAGLRSRLLSGPSGSELKRLFYETEAFLEQHPKAVELRLLHDDLQQAVSIESLQQKLQRVRRPRVHITYDAETYGSSQVIELPFVIGVMAELSGEDRSDHAPLADRQFVDIDRDNFDEVLRKFAPRVVYRCDTDATGDVGEEANIELSFKSMADFEPESVARSIPPLRRLLSERERLQSGPVETSAATLAKIEKKFNEQLSWFMHHPEFRRLERSWRGLHRLVHESETSERLKLRVLNVSWQEVARDLAAAPDTRQSALWHHLYESRFCTLGGEPFAAIVGDYFLDPAPSNVAALSSLAELSERAQLLFVAAASPALLGIDSYGQLSAVQDLQSASGGPDMARWQAFRGSEAARFVGLCMPRHLARLPYGRDGEAAGEFAFDEKISDHEHFCWTNSAYVFALRLTNAYALSGWATAIRGPQGGGLVEGLPATAVDAGGNRPTRLSTETAITDRREAELGHLGLIPLCSLNDPSTAAFYSAQSVYLSRSAAEAGASREGRTMASIPLLMATSRFMHYLMVISRDRVGGVAEAADIERRLNRWIRGYVAGASDDQDPAQKARYPLREARIQVEEVAESPGQFRAIAFLLPHYQLEPIEISLRVVVELPHLLG